MKISTVIFKSENEIYTDGFIQEEKEILKRKLIMEDWEALDLLPVSFLKRIYNKSDGLLIDSEMLTLNKSKAITTVDILLENEIYLDKVYIAHKEINNYVITNRDDKIIYNNMVWGHNTHRKKDISKEDLNNLDLYNLKTYLAASWCKLRTPKERFEINNRVYKEIEQEIEDKLEIVKLKIFELTQDTEVISIYTAGALHTHVNRKLIRAKKQNKPQIEIDNLSKAKKMVKELVSLSLRNLGVEFVMNYSNNKNKVKPLYYTQHYNSDKRYSLLDARKFYKLILQMPFFQQTSSADEIDKLLESIDVKNIRIDKQHLDDEDLIRNHVRHIMKNTIRKDVKKINIKKMLELVKTLYKLDIYCYSIDAQQMSFAVPVENKNAINVVLSILQSLDMISRVSRIYKTNINKTVSSFRDIDTEEYIEISRGERW